MVCGERLAKRVRLALSNISSPSPKRSLSASRGVVRNGIVRPRGPCACLPCDTAIHNPWSRISACIELRSATRGVNEYKRIRWQIQRFKNADFVDRNVRFP